jgi:hypothetical protein
MEDPISKIARNKNIEESVAASKAGALKALNTEIKRGVTPEDYKKILDKHLARPENATKYDIRKSDLEAVGAKDFYEFLLPDMDEGVRRAMSPAQLSFMAKEIKTAAGKKKGGSAERSALEKACGVCEIVFRDDGAKRDYDAYLDYKKKEALLREVKELYQLLGAPLSEEDEDEFVMKLMFLLGDKKTAKEVFAAYCCLENIPYRGA